MSKRWIYDHFGKPQTIYRLEKMNPETGKKKKVDITERLPSTHLNGHLGVDVFKMLKLVTKAEFLHPQGIRNIQVCWNVTPERGHGEDREGAYVEYWIEFERLETDAEEMVREHRENTELLAANSAAAEKMESEKEMYERLKAKYEVDK